MRTLLAFLICCGCSVMMATMGWAADSMSQRYIDAASMHEQLLTEAKQGLEQHDPATWTDAALANYQFNMGAAVYNSVVAYCMDNEELPSSLEDVVGSYLTQWPLNPQNNWEPVRVLSLGEGFSAGDIVYQECPFSYYSITGRIKDGTLAAQSFEFSVYGPSIDHYQECSFNLANEDWGIIPQGAILSMGMYTEPAIDVIARVREREEAERQAGEAE